MHSEEPTKPIDLTRLNRAQRRMYQKNTGIKVQGRNLPFIKKLHGSYEAYYAKRAEEIKSEEESHGKID